MRCREEERAPDKPGGVFNQNMGESFLSEIHRSLTSN